MTTKSLLTIPAILACFTLSAVGDIITPDRRGIDDLG